MPYLLACLWILIGSLSAYGQEKYWVFFQDKDLLASSVQLSDAALFNRARQNIALDSRDFPLASKHLQSLQEIGIPLIHRSRWLNAASVWLSPDQLSEVIQLPGVRAIRPVRHTAQVSKQASTLAPQDEHSHRHQLETIGVDVLQQQRYTGKGVRIAVFDNGFLGVDSLPAFAHLFEENRILATRDFVDGDETLFHPCGHCRHGTNVLSLLAARWPGHLIGAAPDAEYILLRTEDDHSETHLEEDNWIAAAEYADSLGAQIFTTSLGYYDFDAGEGDYSFADLDGNTALITVAADIAAAKGILVVNSAGNRGTRGLSAPADGDSVLAVAAVGPDLEVAAFSGRGPSFDGRIKPELAAMGFENYIMNHDGELRLGNGTSFSCPLITGLGACLQQAIPQASAWDIRTAMIQSAHQFEQPDNVLGYGIPDGAKALVILGDLSVAERASSLLPFSRRDIVIYPNPSRGIIRLAFAPGLIPGKIELAVFDPQGRRVITQEEETRYGQAIYRMINPPGPGLYVVRVRMEAFPQTFYQRKLAVIF